MTDSKELALREALEAAKMSKSQNPAAYRDAWNTLSNYIVGRDGLPSGRGYSSRAGQRQYKERKAISTQRKGD